jgi:crotonobetainyl-CoA hydratase/dehydration protein DpgD
VEYCIFERDGHVARITFNRPEVMNSLHAPAHWELHEVWNEFAADDDLWVAVLTGAGNRAFCAGNDLKVTAAQTTYAGQERPAVPPSGFAGLCSRFDLFKPIVARVNGYALGGGLEIALACDIIVAAEHAELGLPEPRRGLIAGALGVHRLPRQIGLKQAMGHMLTGRHMSARRAYELGLVNEVVPLERLDEAVDAWVADIVRCAPLSVRSTKQCAIKGLNMSLEEAAATRFEIENLRRKSEDAVEGPRAFAEKREPVWQGR